MDVVAWKEAQWWGVTSQVHSNCLNSTSSASKYESRVFSPSMLALLFRLYASESSARACSHGSTGAAATFHTSPSQPPALRTRRTSVIVGSGSNQCHASAASTASSAPSSTGMFVGTRSMRSSRRIVASEYGEHPLVRFDRVDLKPAGKEPFGELPGSCTDVCDASGCRRREPVHGCCGVGRAPPVVLFGELTKRRRPLAQGHGSHPMGGVRPPAARCRTDSRASSAHPPRQNECVRFPRFEVVDRSTLSA